MNGAPSSFLLLVVRPGAPSSVLAPSMNSFGGRTVAGEAPHFPLWCSW